MRVAVVTPELFGPGGVLGGGERYAVATAVAAASADDRLQVEVLAVGPAGEGELAPGVRWRSFPADVRSHHRQDALSWGLLEAVEGASVVHVHQAFVRLGQAVVLAAATCGARVVLTDHGGGTLSSAQRRALAGLGDAVVAYSRFGAALQPGPRVEVVPGGVDLATHTPPAAPPRRDRFLFVGRVLPHKGVDALVRHLPAGAALTIAGSFPDPAYRAVVEAEVARRADDVDVEVLEAAGDAELVERYQRALAVVLPSRYVDHLGRRYVAPELMGLVVLEGAACGTAAVVTDVGALPEYVADGRTGFVVADDEGLGRRLAELAADPGRAEAMGAAARAAVAPWALDAVGERLAALYRELGGAG